MIKSMTGFGQGEATHGGYKALVELKSVNHRFLDIALRLPHHMLFLDDGIRKSMQAMLSRGHVEAFVRYETDVGASTSVTVDYPLLQAYVDAYLAIRERVDIYDDITLSHIVKLPDVVKPDVLDLDQEALEAAVQTALGIAIDALVASRQAEGYAIQHDMTARIATVQQLTQTIDNKAAGVVDEYRVKLAGRIEQLLQGQELDTARFTTEVALFADRCNIDEELVRMQTHCKQFIQDCKQDAPVGRKLDFLLQEMNREANTMGSKSADIIISQAVIDIKCELEKIREQLQNVE